MIDDLSWQSLEPVLTVDGQTRVLRNGEQLGLSLSNSRYCVGFHQYGLGVVPCPSKTSIPAGRTAQCEFCRQQDISFTAKTGFGLSKEAGELLSSDHVVYLAYFAEDIIKVGVSLWDRREVRVSEQGALACLFIAKGNGTAARNLERKIHTHVGLTEWVPQAKKLCAIGRLVPTEFTMRRSLEAVHATILDKTPSAMLLAEPVFLHLAPRYQLHDSITSKELYLANLVNSGAQINGAIAGIYGKLILIATPEDTILAISSELLKGFSLINDSEGKVAMCGIQAKLLPVNRQQNLFDVLL